MLNKIRISNVISTVPILPTILNSEDPLIIVGFLLSVAKKSNALVKQAGGLIGEISAADLFLSCISLIVLNGFQLLFQDQEIH